MARKLDSQQSAEMNDKSGKGDDPVITLTTREWRTVERCVDYLCYGPPARHFHTLTGADLDEGVEIQKNLSSALGPYVTTGRADPSETDLEPLTMPIERTKFITILHCMNYVCAGQRPQEFREVIGVDHRQAYELFLKMSVL